MQNKRNTFSVQTFAQHLTDNVQRVLVGAHSAIEQAILGFLCRGHLLIDDVPGIGKTMLARALARSLGCSFTRIQFTPDILPSDITGVHTFDKTFGAYKFQPGPIMAQIVLIDEINRAAPKAQAALLEAMEERQITVDTKNYFLPDPFIVLATENRIERHSTFPLPKSQLDRFFFRIQLGYPSPQEEIALLDRNKMNHPIENLQQIASVEELYRAQTECHKIHVSSIVERYIVNIVEQTRRHPDVFLGGSVRSSLVLYRGCQALAAVRGRKFVLPDDVKAIVKPALIHRILLSPRAHLRKLSVDDILERILQTTPVSGEKMDNAPNRLRFSFRKSKPVANSSLR